MMQHGKWRMDKDPEEGFTRELYCPAIEKYLDKTNLDELNYYKIPGNTTMTQVFERAVERIPNHDWIGERISDKVEDGWKYTSFKDVIGKAKLYSLGLMKLDLCPTVLAEGKEHKFMVLVTYNSLMAMISYCSSFYQSVTNVGMNENLKDTDLQYMIKVTQNSTVSVSPQNLKRIIGLIKADTDGDMKLIKNIVVFNEDESPDQDDQKKACEEVGLNLYTFDQVMEVGKNELAE
jgi:long-subunit acyl-CoA synthetase (AMP-forming)